MPLLTRTQPRNTPELLAAELADARQAYIEQKDSVLNRAAQRQAAVQSTIDDLQAEHSDLQKVVEEANRP